MHTVLDLESVYAQWKKKIWKKNKKEQLYPMLLTVPYKKIPEVILGAVINATQRHTHFSLDAKM